MAEQSGLQEQLAERRTGDRRPVVSPPHRSQEDSLASVPHTLLALQRAAGNTAVSELLAQPAGPGVLHIQRDDSHAPPAAPAKVTDLDEQANDIIKAAQAETPGIEERAVNAVSAIINTYFADKKDMVTLVKYVESELGLLTTSQGRGKKATGVISVGLPFIKDLRGGFGHFARRVLQVAHELEHIQQYRDGMGGAGKKHEREFLAFYHEGTATEVAHTGRMRPDMRVKLLDGAISNYNAMPEDDQKRYADQYKEVVERRASEQKDFDEKYGGHKAGGKKAAESPDAGEP